MTAPAAGTALVVRVPGLPPHALSANRRQTNRGYAHRLRRDLATTWGYAARFAVDASWSARSFPPDGPIAVRITVRLPRNAKKWDDDNFLGTCKAGLDAVADVLDVNDRRFRFQPLEWERDPLGVGETIVELWAESEEGPA